MKQDKLIGAYQVTDELANQANLTIKGKWVLYKLRKDLSPHYDFQIEENKRLMEQFNGQYNFETNMINFATTEEAEAFKHEHEMLDNLEVETNIEKQEIKLSDIPDITIHQIEMLEDFLEFIPE